MPGLKKNLNLLAKDPGSAILATPFWLVSFASWHESACSALISATIPSCAGVHSCGEVDTMITLGATHPPRTQRRDD